MTEHTIEHHEGTGLGELLSLEEGRKRLAQYQQTTEGLTDEAFIELLWKCAYWSAELMPSGLPDSALHRQWSKWLEDATVERHRRETISNQRFDITPADVGRYVRRKSTGEIGRIKRDPGNGWLHPAWLVYEWQVYRDDLEYVKVCTDG